jgi:hypothetical protein
MINFLKRNIKAVIITGVSVFIIAGLSTALIMTTAASGRGGSRNGSRDGGRERNHARIELTEEQIAEREEQRAQRLAERLENARERLEQKLADGSITQEEYNEKLATLDSGEYPFSRGDRRGSGNKSEKSEEND